MHKVTHHIPFLGSLYFGILAPLHSIGSICVDKIIPSIDNSGNADTPAYVIPGVKQNDGLWNTFSFASSSNFTIRIQGKSAHAASPELSIDPVVIAAQAVMALQTIRSRNLSPFEPGAISIAQIHGGIRDNIIPAEVQLSGTVRLFNHRTQDEVEQRFRTILDGTTAAAGGSYTLDYRRGTPVNMNDSALQLAMLPTMERTIGKNNVRMIQPFMASDDYAFYAQLCPSFFFSLGTTRPGTDSGSLHTSTFMGDDASIVVGIKTVSALVIDFLKVKN